MRKAPKLRKGGKLREEDADLDTTSLRVAEQSKLREKEKESYARKN